MELEASRTPKFFTEDEVDFDKINVGCTVKAYDITFGLKKFNAIGRFNRG